jgi:hypothetical protein
MTAGVLERGRAPRALPVPVVLGLQEGRRILLHPISLLGLVLLMAAAISEGGQLGPRGAFEITTALPVFFSGVFTYFAAHLVASRDRRAHSGELLAAVPAPRTSRVAGLCVAALVPALFCAAYVLALHSYFAATGTYVDAPSAWHLAHGPLTVLGGALLGTMVARLAIVPGAALLVMIAMVAANGWLNSREDIQTLATFVSWPVWDEGDGWHGVQPGSAAWHAVYLAALCAMAATGAFLREARNRFRVLCIGGVFTAAAAAAGVLQLP